MMARLRDWERVCDEDGEPMAQRGGQGSWVAIYFRHVESGPEAAVRC